MIVAVGSANKGKLEAVRAAFGYYFKGAEVKGMAVDSGVSGQPTSLEEIVNGAKNRARNAFESVKCDFAVGIEAGIFPFPETASGYMDTGCCVIYDGQEFYIGCSPLFEYPKKAVEKVLNEGKEIAEVFKELYSETDHHKGGQGAVGFLSKGAMPRTKFVEAAVTMALLRIVNKEAYGVGVR